MSTPTHGPTDPDVPDVPTPDRRPGLTRRRAIIGATVLGVGGGALAALQGTRNRVGPPDVTPKRPTSQRTQDYSARQAYDAAEATYRRTEAEHPETSPSNGGALAWGESRVMSSYLTMYRATGDTGYLDKLVEASQPVLAARDDHRGKVDYRGLSLPGWASAEDYTVTRLDLADAAGDPALRLVAAVTEERMLVDVRPGPAHLFDLSVKGSSGLAETVRNLSLDPGHRRYAVGVLEQQYPGPAALTAVDLRRRPDRDGVLASGAGVQMTAQRYIFAVHTGMIATPWAQFAALLRQEPALRGRYAGPGVELLRAAEMAVHVHDADWRQLSEKAGLYTFAAGSPVRADGTYLPHNQYLAVARCFAHLYLGSNNPEYRERATLMLNLFRSDLSPGPAPTWPYNWSGSQPYRGFGLGETNSVHTPQMAPSPAPEDPSHGAQDLAGLVAGFDAGLGVSANLMSRLVGTYFSWVVRQDSAGSWTTAQRFGSSANLPAADLAAVRWIELARWDRRVYHTVAAVLDQLKPAPREGQVLSAQAQMVALG